MLRRSKNILCIIIIWYIFWLLFCRLRSYMTVQFITDKRTPQDRNRDWNKQQQGCTILNCFPKGNDSTGLSDVAMILIHLDITCKYVTFLKSKLISNNTREFDSDWPWRGWTTACCLLGLLTAGCFLTSGAVLFLKAGSCLPLDFSPVKRLKSLALLSNSFCFSFSSCKHTKGN